MRALTTPGIAVKRLRQLLFVNSREARDSAVPALRPEWRDAFADECYRSSISQSSKLFAVAVVLLLTVLLTYDLPHYRQGLFAKVPLYPHLFAWRMSMVLSFSAFLIAARHFRSNASRDIQRWLTRMAIFAALVMGTWHAIISQMLSFDTSIFALCMFAVSVLIVTPSRRSLLVYPIAATILLVGVYLLQPQRLVSYAITVNALCVTICALFADQVTYRAFLRNFVLRKTLAEERERSDRLLTNILPDAIAARLRNSDDHVVEFHDEVAVLFADVVDFTKLATEMAPGRLIQLLEMLFKAFDDLADQFGVEKIKTVGDAYMAAAGVPAAVPDAAARVAGMALAMLATCERLSLEAGLPLRVRIGIHTGPAISGVIAQKKFAYDLWGDTVNIASRMESQGAVGRIHVTEEVQQKLAGQFQFEQRGSLNLKGKGATAGYFLLQRASVASAA